MGLVVEGMGLVVYGRSYGGGSRRCMSIINFNGIYKIRQTKIKIKCAFSPLVWSNLLLLPRPLLALLPSSTLLLLPFHVPTSLDPSNPPSTVPWTLHKRLFIWLFQSVKVPIYCTGYLSFPRQCPAMNRCVVCPRLILRKAHSFQCDDCCKHQHWQCIDYKRGGRKTRPSPGESKECCPCLKRSRYLEKKINTSFRSPGEIALYQEVKEKEEKLYKPGPLCTKGGKNKALNKNDTDPYYISSEPLDCCPECTKEFEASEIVYKYIDIEHIETNIGIHTFTLYCSECGQISYFENLDM